MDDTADLGVSIENDDEPAAPAQDFDLLSVCPDDEAVRTPWAKPSELGGTTPGTRLPMMDHAIMPSQMHGRRLLSFAIW